MSSEDKMGAGVLAVAVLMFVFMVVKGDKNWQDRDARVKACREIAIRATCLHPEEKAAILDVCR